MSTLDQSLNLQLKELKKAGCTCIFQGKQSGRSKENGDRLQEMIDYLRPGDVGVATKLDRLGRSLRVVLDCLDRIHDQKATLLTLDGAIDTKEKGPMTDAFINLLGTFAQLERDLVVNRLSEGRVAAKAKGVKFGRPSVLTSVQQKEARRLHKKGTSISALARKYSTSRTTIQRLLKRESEKRG